MVAKANIIQTEGNDPITSGGGMSEFDLTTL